MQLIARGLTNSLNMLVYVLTSQGCRMTVKSRKKKRAEKRKTRHIPTGASISVVPKFMEPTIGPEGVKPPSRIPFAGLLFVLSVTGLIYLYLVFGTGGL